MVQMKIQLNCNTETMTNPNGDADSFINDPSAVPFFDWQSQLDYDDEEFRAGQPVLDTPELTLNGSDFIQK